MSFSSLPALLLAGCLVSCADDQEPTSQTDGRAHFDTVAADGTREAFDIVTPNGDVYFELHDRGDAGELYALATNPIASDHRDEADAGRIRLVVRIPTEKVGEALAGRPQDVTPVLGAFFTTDCTLRLEKNTSKDDALQWCAAGGTIVRRPLASEGRAQPRALHGRPPEGDERSCGGSPRHRRARRAAGDPFPRWADEARGCTSGAPRDRARPSRPRAGRRVQGEAVSAPLHAKATRRVSTHP
ncbi:MAG: hypothetical protein BGO98_02425 [Myxococcales bacterium 68-20]|nr:MAG: hypothetical protein BGO98_02425 [Myxococcales bacterium 68-20]